MANLKKDNSFIHENSSHGFENKTIWAFWGDGEKKLPDFELENLRHWRELIGKDWKVLVVSMNPHDDNYVYNFLEKKELPDIINAESIESRRYKSTISPAVLQSDFVRLALLQKYAGIWMDISIIMNRPLQEMGIINEFLRNDKTILAYSYEESSKLKNPIRYFENSFIAVKNKNNPLIIKINEYMRNLYENKKDGSDIAEEPMFKDKKIFDIDGTKYPLYYFWGNVSERNYLSMYAVIQLIAFENSVLYQDNVFLKSAKGSENGFFNLSDEIGGFGNIELVAKNFCELISNEVVHDALIKKLRLSDMIKLYGALRARSIEKMQHNHLVGQKNLISKLWAESLGGLNSEVTQ